MFWADHRNLEHLHLFTHVCKSHPVISTELFSLLIASSRQLELQVSPKTTSLREKTAFSHRATSNCGQTKVHRCRFKPTAAAAQCVITPQVMFLWPLTSEPLKLMKWWAVRTHIKSFVILSDQMEKTQSWSSDETQSTVLWEQMKNLMSCVENSLMFFYLGSKVGFIKN